MSTIKHELLSKRSPMDWEADESKRVSVQEGRNIKQLQSRQKRERDQISFALTHMHMLF